MAMASGIFGMVGAVTPAGLSLVVAGGVAVVYALVARSPVSRHHALSDQGDVDTANIAITGGPNSGKSQLIDALRRLPRTDPGAAASGPMQGTTEPRMYAFQSEHGMFNLWDLPAYPRANLDARSFAQHMGLGDFFKAVVLVVGTRVTDLDKQIVQMLRDFNVPHWVALTKVDTIPEMDEEQGETMIRTTLMHEMKVDRVYLVSSRMQFWDRWDLPELRDDILGVHRSR